MGRFCIQGLAEVYFCRVNVEIIAIGDELLLGQTVDTNSTWMGLELSQHGFAISRKVVISDDPVELTRALNESLSRVQAVLVTGGLGPTLDDRTKETLAEYFGTKLELHEPALRFIRSYFQRRNLPFLEANKLQAMLPVGEGCTILPNPRGTAQGMWFEHKGAVVVSMPGVPNEMKGLMREEVIPALTKRFERPFRFYRTILCFGKGESFLSALLGDWESDLQHAGISLAYLPAHGQVRIRLSASGENESQVRDLVNQAVEEASKLLSPFVASTEHEDPAHGVAALLLDSRQRVAVAESFTGGSIASRLTLLPGASNWFNGGVVTYTDAAKVSHAGVDPETLRQFGAVSEEVALQMAHGIRQSMGADWALATTGYAGPGEGEEVGKVYISLLGPGGLEVVHFQHWGRSREMNIHRGVTYALHLIWSALRKHQEDCQKKVV
jgi:nicotinamide-nucleotide amidase